MRFYLWANNYLGQGQPKLALSALNQAHTAFDEEGDQMMLARVMVREGCALADMRNFAEAERMHKDAANLAKTLKDNDVLALALYEQGYDNFMEGAVDKALNHFMALSDFIKSGANLSDQDIEAEALIGVAQCYSAMGQQAAAIKYYEMAVEKYKKVENKLGEISTANSIASTYLNFSSLQLYKNKYQELNSMLDTVPVELKNSREYKTIAGSIAFNQAQFDLMSKQYDPAISEFKKCIALFEQSGNIKKIPSAYTSIGLACLLQATGVHDKDPVKKAEGIRQAIGYFEKALPLAKEFGLLEQQWDCAIGLGSCYRIVGDKEKAEINLRKAISLFEKEKNLHSRDDSKTYTLDLRGSSFQELVALLVDEGRFDEALEIAEKGRARAFLDLLEGRRTTANKSFIAQSAPPVAAPVAVPAKVAPTAKPELIAMAPPPAGPSGVMRSVEVLPKASGFVLDSTFSDVSAKAPDIKEIKELVKQSKSYVVEYFVTGPRLYIFVIDPTGEIKAAKPVEINIAELTQKVVNAYQAIITPPKDLSDLKASNERRQKYLTDLHTILIDPIQSLLPKDPEQVVTIVPHDALYKVPFAALTAKDGKLLIEDHTLAVIPAVGVFRATHQLLDQANTSNALLAFGNPTLKQVGGLGALPFAEREVKKISDLFGAANSTVRVKDDASGVALRDLAPKAAIIHLATHGLIDEERPMDSAVLLAASGSDDGILSVRDILKMPPLKAKLITLSACQTGRGKISGDGVAGLSRAFILAGTPSVLVSLWNVDDVMTEYQMGAFYQSYLAGNNKAKALREAQIKTLNFMEKGLAATPPGALKVRANPRYWSAFQLVGEYR
jgi:CHAT domain-containing protein/tetratricopeptide (TPR) repeat protein